MFSLQKRKTMQWIDLVFPIPFIIKLYVSFIIVHPQSTQLQKVGLSLDVINNITNSSNRMNPALLQQLALHSNGSFHNLDLRDPSSIESISQYSRSFQYGEYGFDVWCCWYHKIKCIFRIRSSGGVSIHPIQSNLSINHKDVGIKGIQFTSNSSNINHLSFITSNTVIPFDFQYSSPSGS